MLYAAYILFSNYLMPLASTTFQGFINGLGPIVVIILGISLIFGVKSFTTLASTVLEGSMNIVVIIVRAVLNGIASFLKWFFNLIPNVYRNTKEHWRKRGGSPLFCNIMALIATLVVIAIIV